MINGYGTIEIEKLAGLGDGMGMAGDRKIFVPYTMPGDVVEVQVIRTTTDADYGRLVRIVTPSPERTVPVCRHFAECGSCSLQHLPPALYNGFKQQVAEEAIRKAGFELKADTLVTLPASSRRRAELKMDGDSVGYYRAGTQQIVDITECAVLEQDLMALILQIRQQLAGLSGITAIHINAVDGGYDVVLEGNTAKRPLLEGITAIKRLSLGKGTALQTLYQHGDIVMSIGENKVEIPPAAFLQASHQAQQILTDLVKHAVKDAGTILDLFAGIGTYSLVLAANADVTAMEGDRTMVAALQKAAKGLTLKAVVRDLFQAPVPAHALKHYDAVIINPPRTGAKSQTQQLATSGVKKIVMVSCNPATFARDARVLKSGGYHLLKLTPVDQFVFSSHLELVAEFSK